MKELSLHILDIVQNSVQAKASNIKIEIIENTVDNFLSIEIKDNGCGMSKELLNRTLDPFFTTKNKKTGLGIPLFKQHAEMAGGSFFINSIPNDGTSTQATFELNNIDRQPMGNLTTTITGLIRSFPETNFTFTYITNEKKFELKTKEIKEEIGDLRIDSSEIINFLKEMIIENLKDIKASAIDFKLV